MRILGKRFGLLWAGQSLSLLGDQITLIALPLLAVRYLHSTTMEIGALGACLRFPFLVLGLPAGVWVTRLGFVRSMLGADVLRGLAVALVPAVVVWGGRSTVVLFAGALVLGIGAVFFQVSYQSVVPELIADEHQWHAANTRLSLSESLALLVGPAVGGLIVARLAATGALGIDACTYAVSVVSLAAIGRLGTRTAPVHLGPRQSLYRQILDGIDYVRRNPILNCIMWTGALYNLGSAMYDSLLVLFAVRELHLSAATLGVVIGVGAVGFPLGSVLSKSANARLGMGRSLIWAAVPSVAGLLVAASAAGHESELYLVAGTFLVGLGQGCFAVNAITMRQRTASPEMRAQATSVHRFVSWGALPLGSLIAGIVGELLGVRTAMIASGIVAAACFWPLLTAPLRTDSNSLAHAG